jgi:hypothetical protein
VSVVYISTCGNQLIQTRRTIGHPDDEHVRTAAIAATQDGDPENLQSIASTEDRPTPQEEHVDQISGERMVVRVS